MKILIPLDGSDHSNAALAFVASRSTLIGRQPHIDLLNVQLPIPPSPSRLLGRDAVRSFHRMEATAVLQPALVRLKKAGITARAKHVVGTPGPAIGRTADKDGADLIVMGSRGRTAFKGLLFGSVTQAVLANCKRPLLLLRTPKAPTRDSLTVGIAVDGSRYGLAAARFVARHRDLFGKAPTLRLIHVVPDMFTLVMPGLADAPMPVFSADQFLASQKAGFDKAVTPARKLLAKAGLEASEVCLVGNRPGDEIARYATRSRLDVLVMGSHGHSALQAVTLGSVATSVAARCRTPLLLVRGGGKST
jgi:nucleotide-binding universal stress UspA family protein